MKNLFLSAALVLAMAANATTLNTVATDNATGVYQEKEYKKIAQNEIVQPVLKSAVEKYKDYALVEAFVAADGTDYKLVLTKDNKDVAVYYKSNGEFLKEEAVS